MPGELRAKCVLTRPIGVAKRDLTFDRAQKDNGQDRKTFRQQVMTNRIDDAFRFQQMVLDLRTKRQDLIASNIANADTPNFKARDIDFEASLKNAMSGKDAAPTTTLERTDPAHLQPAAGSGNDAQVLYRSVAQGSVDGNTVDVDGERARFMENAVHIEANLTFLSGQMKMLMTAIQGQ